MFRIPFRYFDSVSIRQTLFPALFGAAHLTMDTPAGNRKHADVGLTLSRKALWRTVSTVYSFSKAKPLYHAGNGRILLMSAFWSNPGTGLLLLAPFVQRVGSILGKEIQEKLYATVDISLQLAAWGIPPASAATAYLLFAGWVIALIVQLFRYAHFRLDLGKRSSDHPPRAGSVPPSDFPVFPHLRPLHPPNPADAPAQALQRLCAQYRFWKGQRGPKYADSGLLPGKLLPLLGAVVPWFPSSFSVSIRPGRAALKSYLLVPFYCAAGFFLILLFPYLLGAYSQLFPFPLYSPPPFS